MVRAGLIKIRLGAVLENSLLYLEVEVVDSIGAWPEGVKTLNHLCPMILVLDVGRRDIGEMNAHMKGSIHLRHRNTVPTETDVSKSEVNQNGVRYLYRGKGIPHTYVEAELKGRKIPGMFDMGCEVSLCPYKFCRNAKLLPTDVKLFAANDSEIKVLGKKRLMFSVGGVPTNADLIVTDKVTEFLLGMDFMCANDCEWLVSKGRILIRGRSVLFIKCPHKANVRCVIVQDSNVVPADFAMAVPVKMPLMHPKMSDSEWIPQAKELRPGLLVARTLLPHSSMLNVSGMDQTLRHDTQISIATPCQTDYMT